MNPTPAFSAASVTTSNLQAGNTASATWINKLKIVGRGQNWAVAPCEPFYLMGTEPPAPDAALTGAKNLIEHYGLENAYQKFCGKRLREELNAFLPHLSGNIDVPASVDESGLMSLIERPPIRGKELRPFAPSQLDHAFRLHPGPLPQEYASLFAAAPSKHIHRSVQNELQQQQPQQPQSQQQQNLGNNPTTGTRIPATVVVPGLSNSASFHRRRRRHEVHRGALASGSDSSSSIGVSGVGLGGGGAGNVSASPASFFTGPPPTAYPHLSTIPTTASTLSSKSLLSQTHTISSSSSITTSTPSTNVTTISNQSLNNLDPHHQHPNSNNPTTTQVVNHNKLLDHPPGLIPVSIPHSHSSTSSSISTLSSEPPPPPLLAPIINPHHHHSHSHHSHHSSNQKLSHSNQNTPSTLNLLHNSNNNSSNSTTDLNITPNKSIPPAPPILHSIHPPSINSINSTLSSHPPTSQQFYSHHPQQQQQQQHQFSSHVYHHQQQHPMSSSMHQQPHQQHYHPAANAATTGSIHHSYPTSSLSQNSSSSRSMSPIPMEMNHASLSSPPPPPPMPLPLPPVPTSAALASLTQSSDLYKIRHFDMTDEERRRKKRREKKRRKEKE